MRTVPKKFFAVAVGFLLLGWIWTKYGNAVLLWQSALPDGYRAATAFLVGMALWHATGFDDAILFAGNLAAAKDARGRFLSHLGLYSSVLVMLAAVYLSGAVIAEAIRQLRWIVVAALVWVSWKTFPDEHWLKSRILSAFRKIPRIRDFFLENGSEDPKSAFAFLDRYKNLAVYPFALQFVSFTANSSDDYVANTAAIMVLGDEASRLALLSGVFVGAVSMALLVTKYHERVIPHDVPAIRGWIFAIIAAVIAFS